MIGIGMALGLLLAILVAMLWNMLGSPFMETLSRMDNDAQLGARAYHNQDEQFRGFSQSLDKFNERLSKIERHIS